MHAHPGLARGTSPSSTGQPRAAHTADAPHAHAPSPPPPPRRYIPLSGGPRKCVGDQFALMEAVVALTVLLKQFDFSLVPNQKIEMTTGATIHTTNGLYMNVKLRGGSGSKGGSPAVAVTAA